MTERNEVRMAATEMWDAAKAHGNRYLLPRRLSRPGTDPEKDILYDAAEWLVSEGYAKWIDAWSTMNPGITLTLKDITDDRYAAPGEKASES